MIVPDWQVSPAIKAVVTTTQSGNLATHVGDPAAALVNRARLVSALSLPRDPLWMEQIHGDHLHAALGYADREPRADAAYTKLADLPLVVLVADCLPVFLASDAGEIAVVHAGWRGLAANAIGKTVARFTSRNLSAWMGPAIGPCHYEVDAVVRRSFESDVGFIPGRDPNHWSMDLTSIAALQLRNAGVKEIGGGGFCTCCDDRFYSHRENSAQARMAAVIWKVRSDS